jgi:hypothetical protein
VTTEASPICCHLAASWRTFLQAATIPVVQFMPFNPPGATSLDLSLPLPAPTAPLMRAATALARHAESCWHCQEGGPEQCFGAGTYLREITDQQQRLGRIGARP